MICYNIFLFFSRGRLLSEYFTFVQTFTPFLLNTFNFPLAYGITISQAFTNPFSICARSTSVVFPLSMLLYQKFPRPSYLMSSLGIHLIVLPLQFSFKFSFLLLFCFGSFRSSLRSIRYRSHYSLDDFIFSFSLRSQIFIVLHKSFIQPATLSFHNIYIYLLS